MKVSTDTTGVGVRRDSIKTKTTEIQDYKKEIGNKYENINDIDLLKQLKGS
jgi:gas vesicle protein